MSRKIYIIIAMVFTVVLSVSTFFIIRNHIDSAKQNEVYDNLAEIVEDEPPKENEGVTFSEDKDYLAEYLELYRQNEDMVGWIKVEDTNINYPVVQSVNEPNFYLKHKFDKTYSAYGCPYVQENCDVQKPSDNIIIYTVLFDAYGQSMIKLRYWVLGCNPNAHDIGERIFCIKTMSLYAYPVIFLYSHWYEGSDN